MESKKLRFTLLVVSFFIFNISIHSQEVNDTSIYSDTTEITEDADDYSYFMLNFSYTNNNLENLTGTTEKIPSLFSTLTYTHKSGLYAGVSYSNYFNTDNKTFDYDLEAGYQKYFGDVFDIDLYYNYHNFEGDSLLEGLNYQHSLNLSSGLDFDVINISADASYFRGNTNNFFLDINLTKYFIFNKLFSKNDYFMISPAVSASFGTDYWLYEDMRPLEKYVFINRLEIAGYTAETFSYEGINLSVPISYSISNLAFTFSYTYKIPGKKYQELGWENRSAYMVSLTWFLNFKK